MFKLLVKVIDWVFSIFDTAADKATGAVEKVAAQKEADYRELLAKEGVPPIKVWQVRRLADPYDIINVVIKEKPMSEKTLASKENRYLSNQYDDCEVVGMHGWERMLTLTIKQEEK